MLENQLLKLVENKLKKENLPIAVNLWNGTRIVGDNPSSIELTINSPSAYSLFINPTLSTLAESYVKQEIDVKGEIRNIIHVLAGAFDDKTKASWMSKLSNFVHTKERDKEAIAHHYDVSNDFYSLWLDKQKVYSCAYYKSADDSLDTAQEQKLDHICKKLNLQSGERLLDIGCGWGALILHAAEKYGVHCTGITLSENQSEHVRKEIAERGLSHLVDVRIQDYRDVAETRLYDKIVSVGMFEHVGVKNLPTYFDKIYKLLKPGGVVLNHGITSSNFDGGSSSSGGDFIDKYVFPNGELSHIHVVVEKMARQGLEVMDTESLRRHYAQTLWTWVENLEKEQVKARELVGEDKYRIWHAYMGGCAYAFEKNWINIYQILATKPMEDGKIEYPLTREHVYNK